MRSFLMMLVLLGAVISQPAVSVALPKNPGYCSAAGPPDALGGSFDSADFKFRWDSDAGTPTAGTVCFDRIVRNNHSARKLPFEWSTGELSSSEGVPPGGEMRYNAVLSAGGFETRQGPLYYGAKGSSVPTSVYRAREGLSQASEATSKANYDLTILDQASRVVALRFSISSSFAAAAPAGRYAYAIENSGKGTLFLAWGAKEPLQFMNAIDAYRNNRPEIAFDVPAGLRIAAGQEATFFLNAKGPWIKRTMILIYSADRKPIAVAPYPGLFPP